MGKKIFTILRSKLLFMTYGVCLLKYCLFLQQMVLNFRRADLIELLGFVGHNKAGTKATLQQRALALVQSQRGFSLPVQIKIRDIYR